MGGVIEILTEARMDIRLPTGHMASSTVHEVESSLYQTS